MPAQEKMVLTADIRYKGNWQQLNLKGQCLAPQSRPEDLNAQYSYPPEQMDECSQGRHGQGQGLWARW